MKFIHTLVFFYLLTVVACTDQPNTLQLENIPTLHVHLQPLNLENAPLFPKGCCATDSLLVIFDPKDKEGFLSFYKGKQLQKRYGSIGNGPNDFIHPRFLTNGKSVDTPAAIQIGESDAFYTLPMDIMQTFTAKTDMKRTDIPKELSPYNYIVWDTDSLLVLNQTGNYQLSFFNKTTQQVEQKNYFQPLAATDGASDFCYATQIYDAYYSSNGQTLAIAYKNRKLIEILSPSGERLNQLYFPGYDYNDGKMSLHNDNLELSEEARTFFTFTAVSQGDYFFLCWDDTKKNIREGKARNLIYHTDAMGQVKQIFQLDKCISYFCLNANRLYAIGLTEDTDLQIYQAELSSF